MDVLLACLCAGLVVALVRQVRTTTRTTELLRGQHGAEIERLSGLALHDSLTGLPNRVLLVDRLRHALASQRRRGGRVGVLFLDLDGFKAVNDVYGHAVGDEVLATIAARLRRAVRSGDTPARLGGDEFVIVCEGVVDEAALIVAAQRLEGAVCAPIVLGDITVRLGASIGRVLSDPDCVESPSYAATRLLTAADHNMYDVKRARQLRLIELGVLNQLAARSVPLV